MLVVPDLLRRLSFSKNRRFVLIPVYGLNTPFGSRTIVQVAFRKQCFFDARLHPSPNSVPSEEPVGAASVFQNPHQQDQEQIRRFAGTELGREVRFDAVFFHSSKRGLVTITSTRSFKDQSFSGRDSVLSCRMFDGTSMPCSSMLVRQDVRKMLLFDAGKAVLNPALVASVLACLRRCSIAQTRKPPVPHAGSITDFRRGADSPAQQ